MKHATYLQLYRDFSNRDEIIKKISLNTIDEFISKDLNTRLSYSNQLSSLEKFLDTFSSDAPSGNTIIIGEESPLSLVHKLNMTIDINDIPQLKGCQKCKKQKYTSIDQFIDKFRLVLKDIAFSDDASRSSSIEGNKEALAWLFFRTRICLWASIEACRQSKPFINELRAISDGLIIYTGNDAFFGTNHPSNTSDNNYYGKILMYIRSLSNEDIQNFPNKNIFSY